MVNPANDQFMQDLFKDYPEAVIIDANNPVFVGNFVRLEKAPTKDYGDAFVAVMIPENESDKEVSIWLLHTVLLNEMVRYRPGPGERVGIRYIGLKGDKPNQYHAYKVMVDGREQGATTWDDAEKESGAESSAGWDEANKSASSSKSKASDASNKNAQKAMAAKGAAKASKADSKAFDEAGGVRGQLDLPEPAEQAKAPEDVPF